MKPVTDRRRVLRIATILTGLLVFLWGGVAADGDALESATIRRVDAVEGLSAGGGDEALRRFIAEHLAPEFVASLPDGELIALLRDIRKIGARAGEVSIGGDETGMRIAFRGSENADVRVRIEQAAPYRITSLAIDRDVALRKRGDDIEAITWDTLTDRLDKAEELGFSGTVLIVRNGKEFLHRGYGKADRETGRPNTTATIFGIGSTPIDFTKVSILLLEQMGKLKLSDTIDRHIAGVPDDKRTMTLDHLMNGRSGLPNFHHIPDVDSDYDLTWIDRETAIRRILDRELLFAPGSDKAHSHSAFGLLAAIVEIVSGSSYGDFLEQRIFRPAGMKQTGFYGPDPKRADTDFAVGYGLDNVGKINIPLYWGKTSWLVMGSGGMFSTPADIHRFVRTIESGKILHAAAREKFMVPGIYAGASDRGFLFMYTLGTGDLMFLASNSLEQEERTESIAKALARLVMAGG